MPSLASQLPSICCNCFQTQSQESHKGVDASLIGPGDEDYVDDDITGVSNVQPHRNEADESMVRAASSAASSSQDASYVPPSSGSAGGADGGLEGKPIRPKKQHKHGTKRWQLHELVMNTLTLGSGAQNIKNAVKVPPGESLNEWLTIHVIDFYNDVAMLYGILTEYCTNHTCPVMSAGPKYKYLWADGVKVKRPIEVSARVYIDCLLDWLDTEVSDPSKYPLDGNQPHPPKFKEKHVKVAFKRLFRVYAHIYHSHFKAFVDLEAEAHLNTCFKHFIFFVREFDLVDEKQLEPLKALITRFESETEEDGGLRTLPGAS